MAFGVATAAEKYQHATGGGPDAARDDDGRPWDARPENRDYCHNHGNLVGLGSLFGTQFPVSREGPLFPLKCLPRLTCSEL